MSDMLRCKHCGSIEYVTRENGPHLSAYCSKCGHWIKHIKRPANVVRTLKEVDTRPENSETILDDDVPW